MDRGMNVNKLTLPRRRRDWYCEELDGEAVLYDATFGTTCRLNETGYFIYKACDGAASIEDIARRLTDEYDVTLDVAERHVRSTLAELNDGGLLRLPEDVPS